MFRRARTTEGDIVTITVDGTPVRVPAGDTVAAAVLAAGLDWTRESAVSGERRGPWCMMGVCFECLLEIDGEANRQGCLVAVREGMVVKRQRGARELGG